MAIEVVKAVTPMIDSFSAGVPSARERMRRCLAVIRDADRIVVVDETGNAEQGAHGELMARGTFYRRQQGAQHATPSLPGGLG